MPSVAAARQSPLVRIVAADERRVVAWSERCWWILVSGDSRAWRLERAAIGLPDPPGFDPGLTRGELPRPQPIGDGSFAIIHPGPGLPEEPPSAAGHLAAEACAFVGCPPVDGIDATEVAEAVALADELLARLANGAGHDGSGAQANGHAAAATCAAPPDADSEANRATIRKHAGPVAPAVSALNLNLTDRCNLACGYCYAKGGNYERIRTPMTADEAVAGVAAALGRRDPARDFRIEFFGGEPLLNPQAIAAVLDFERSGNGANLAPDADGTRPIVNRISTNLTSLTAADLERLADGRFIVSVSIDGTAPVQDRQRPFKDGRGSFATIYQNLQRVRVRCPDATIVARITAWQQDATLLREVRALLADDLFDYVSIYAAAFGDTKSGGTSHFSERFAEQCRALAAAYPELVGRGRFRGFLELNRILQAMLTGVTVLNHCRAGAGYFTLSPDRTVHPCHRLVGDPAFDLGFFDAWSDPAALAARLRAWRVTVDERSGCGPCGLRYLCGGGCKQQALIATGDLLGHADRICAFSRLLTECALTVLGAMTPTVEAGLRSSFAELDRLFVFCGQPTAPNGRRPGRDPIVLRDGRWQAVPQGFDR